MYVCVFQSKKRSQRDILKRRLNSLQQELHDEKIAYEILLDKYGSKLDETTPTSQ